MEKLYLLYNKDVYRSAMQVCRNADDAIDATQEAFLAVFKRITTTDNKIESFRSYIFVSVRNSSLKLISKRRRTIVVSQDDLPEPDVEKHVVVEADPERTVLIEDQQRIVGRAKQDLTEQQLLALSMCEVDGFSYTEIADKLGMEANAVAQIIMRARRRLKKAVRESAAQAPSTKACADALSLLQRKIEGRLVQEESEWLEPHLRSCEICQTNLAVMEEVGASYRAVIPPAALIMERVFHDSTLAQSLGKGLADGAAAASSAGSAASGGAAISGKMVAAGLGHKLVATVATHPIIAAGFVTGAAVVGVAGVKIASDAGKSPSQKVSASSPSKKAASVGAPASTANFSGSRGRKASKAKRRKRSSASQGGQASAPSSQPPVSQPQESSQPSSSPSSGSGTSSGGGGGGGGSSGSGSGPVIVER